MITLQFKPCVLRLFLCITLFCPLGAFAIDAGDDFNDNIKDPTKWGSDQVAGAGVLTERNQRLEYTCAIPTLLDVSYRPWVLTRFPYNADWEIQIDTSNLTIPVTSLQVNSMGIQVYSPLMAGTGLYNELYASALGGPPARNGFACALENAGTRIAGTDSGGLGVTNGAIRMTFTSATKVLSVFYDPDVSDGYQWVKYGSFGTAGTGGTNGNDNWGLSDTDQISAFVYGFSQGMIVTNGEIYGDNFSEIGGVTPTGGPPSVIPTGTFVFGFPVNNPALTPIVSIIGNYQGLINSIPTRNYNIDVAEDESGKLAVMGTMDGVKNSQGNTQISETVGSIKTMNGQPTAQLNGNFQGTRDGLDVNATGSAQGPVELVDLGGGQKGALGTGSYHTNIGGVTSAGNNLPIRLTVPPGSKGNLRKDWTLYLNLEQRLGSGRNEQMFVSGHLVLPTNENIVFREKKIEYKEDKGYFKDFDLDKGMNVSVTPPRKTDKVKIKLKRLSFVRQGAGWKPSGGTIDYEFLGQKGSARVVDFIP